MPKKGKSKVTPIQRRKIASGKLAGKTHKQIAKETGLAVTTVDHHATDPRTQNLVQRYKQEDEKEMATLWKGILKSIKGRLENPHPLVQGQATREAMKLLVLGDPRSQPVEGDLDEQGGGTLEQLLNTYRTEGKAAS